MVLVARLAITVAATPAVTTGVAVVSRVAAVMVPSLRGDRLVPVSHQGYEPARPGSTGLLKILPRLVACPVKPFLLLATRPEDVAADEEYEASHALHRAGRVAAGAVAARAAPALGNVDLDQWSGIPLGGSPFTTSDAAESAVQLRVEADLRALLDKVVAADHPFLGGRVLRHRHARRPPGRGRRPEVRRAGGGGDGDADCGGACRPAVGFSRSRSRRSSGTRRRSAGCRRTRCCWRARRPAPCGVPGGAERVRDAVAPRARPGGASDADRGVPGCGGLRAPGRRPPYRALRVRG